MDFSEKTISVEKVFKGNVIELTVDTVMLPNGKTATRELIHHPGGVCVLPVDKDKNVYLVRQFRKPYERLLLEAPAGKRNPNEEPLICGKRELLEETGFVSSKYTDLGTLIPTPGYTNEVIYLYVASDVEYKEQNLDDDEFLSVEKYPFEDAYNMCLNGEIEDAKTLAVILKSKALLNL